MAQKQKLELTWIGKGNRPHLEPRILLEDSERSFHALKRATENDIFDNELIFGDNLLALKALEDRFRGKVKCACIDPPYNTGSAFSHYDDGLEHSIWLGLMRERLEIIWQMLTDDGSLWVFIDDREMAYLRVLLDEVCGRKCFLCTIVWQKRYSRDNNSAIGDVHDYIIVFVKDQDLFKAQRQKLPIDDRTARQYRNRAIDSRGPWRAVPMNGEGFRPNQMYPIELPSGRIVYPPEGRHWSVLEPEYERLRQEGRIYFGRDGNSQPNTIRYLSEVPGLTPWSWWPCEEVGHTDEAKKESQVLFGKANIFSTPKPERIIARILHIASSAGDLVLDSFAGSGTTGAVAQKMGRQWIMVELGEHCHTHIIPRLRKVIEGTDPGGITEATNWKGGGGFRYYRLAPSLLEKDRFGNAIISKQYNAAMLAEAMCKLMGFRYDPSESIYWQQGKSTEADFIYVTTQSLSIDQLHQLSDEVGTARSLLICGTAFRSRAQQFSNLELKKIPSSVLQRCEWGKDDYSLKVENLPAAPAPQQPRGTQPSLFEADSQ